VYRFALQDVLIVFVNWRTPNLLVDCLNSLVAEVTARAGIRLVVTDNDSHDDSLERREAIFEQEQWPWARFVPRSARYVNGPFQI
jgi:GT2 family glycosyltransferase